jgi:hypothetical protein
MLTNTMRFFLAIVLMLVGILFTVVGAKMSYDMLLFKRSAIKATGTIIEIKTSTSKGHRITYSPVLSITTVDGKEHIYDVDRYDFTHYTMGQQMEVIYQKGNPIGPQVNTFMQIFVPSLTTLFLGLAGIGLSLYLLKFQKCKNV